MSELETLLARVKAATGPDRELDALVIVALTPDDYRGDDLIYLRPCRKDDNCAPGTYWRKSRSGASLHTAPLLTASIDAALALVEKMLPGWSCLSSTNNVAIICRDWNDDYAPVFWSENFPRVRHEGYEAKRGTIANRPLAILAALLEALRQACDKHTTEETA